MDRESLIRTVLAAVLILALWWAVNTFFGPRPPKPGEEPAAPAPAAPAKGGGGGGVEEATPGPAETPPAPAAPSGEGPQVVEGAGAGHLYPLQAVGAPSAAPPVVLGSDLPQDRFDLAAEVGPVEGGRDGAAAGRGLAVRRLTLARKRFFKTVADRALPPERRAPMHLVEPGTGEPALAVERVRLRLRDRDGWGEADLTGLAWRPVPGGGGRAGAAFEADVADADGTVLATVRQTYRVLPSGAGTPDRAPAEAGAEAVPCYELRLTVEVTARDARVEKAYYVLHGPPALPREGQRSDFRRLVAGRWVEGGVEVVRVPGKKAQEGNVPRIGSDTAWVGQEDKYFAVVVVPMVAGPDGSAVVPRSAPAGGTCLAEAEVSARVVVEGRGEVPLPVVRLRTKAADLVPGKPVRHDYLVYAGPKDPDHLEAYYHGVGLDGLVVWSQCCSFFAPISRVLLAVLEAFHGLVENWGVAIIMLVVVLQVLLLPVNRWSAKSMAEMQRLAPKMQEIREKYAGDQKKMQEEMAKLGGFRAFGGCLPMFIQMPIWIGLYGALLVAIQLRHSAFLPASWVPKGSLFLQDLSAPDMLVHWGEPLYLPGREIPILGWLIGAIQNMLGGGGGITSFNILPIAVGVLMYVSQKMMPMSSAAANPQAQQQQKMMMRIMPIFLAVVLYSAPSGLCLYITTSSVLRLLETRFFRQRWIESGGAEGGGGPAAAPKGPAPGGSGGAKPPPARRRSRLAGRKKSLGERAEAWLRRRLEKGPGGEGPGRKRKR